MNIRPDQKPVLKEYAEARIAELRRSLEHGDFHTVLRTRGAIGELRALVKDLEPRGEQSAPMVPRNSYLDD